jgi:hypothetical protein
MEPIQFHAVVNDDQVIRPPAGVQLPQGEVEVLVRLVESPGDTQRLTSTRNWLLALATEAEQAKPDLPADLAQRHDHYAHGKPLP